MFIDSAMLNRECHNSFKETMNAELYKFKN